PQHLTESPEVRARFEREARTVSSLNHPHICTLHDVGQEGTTDYLVMELVEGETLAARLERGALPVAEVLGLGIQISNALDRTHAATCGRWAASCTRRPPGGKRLPGRARRR